MGIPSIMFINFNISGKITFSPQNHAYPSFRLILIVFSVWVPIFPKWGSFSIPAFHGLFSASGGILLIMKYLYVEFEYQLEEMMYFYASITLIMHIQTFFFTPVTVVPKTAAVDQYSVFQHVSITYLFDSVRHSYHMSHMI